MKSYRIVIGADRFGFDEDTLRFLELFPHNTVFASRSDFIQRCEDLAAMLRDVQESSVQATPVNEGWLLP